MTAAAPGAVPTPGFLPTEPGPRAPLAVFGGAVSLLAAAQVLTIGVSLTGRTVTAGVAAAVVTAAVVVAVIFGWWVSIPIEPRPRRAGPRFVLGRTLGLVAGLAALAGAGWVWAQLLEVARLRDPIGWDGLWYHLPAIQAWSRLGRVAFIESLPDVPFVNGPMGVELTSFLVIRLLGTDRLVDAGNLWFWPLAVSAVALLASRLGARGPYPWIAGALVATCPVFLGLSATVYVDPGLAAAVMAAVAAGALFALDRPPWARTALLFGLALGLAAGAKATGLPYTLLIVGIAAAARIRATGWTDWRRWSPLLGYALGGALLTGGYWYLRNLCVTGNPLYPFQVALGSRVLLPGWDYSYFGELGVPDWMVPVPGWLRAPLAWWRGDGPVGEYMFSSSGLGSIWSLVGLPAAVSAWWLALRRPGSVRRPVLTFVTVTVALLLLVSPIPWRSRLTIWLLGLGLPAAGLVLHHAASRRRLGLGPALLFLAAGLGIGVAAREARGILGRERERTPPAAARYASALALHFPGLGDDPGFAALLAEPRIARGRWATEYGTLFGGVLALPVGRRDVVVVPAASAGYRDPYGDASERRAPDAADLERLVASGIRWMIWDAGPDAGLPPALLPFVEARFVYRHPAGDVLYALRLIPLRP